MEPVPAGFCDSFWEGRGDWSALVADAKKFDEYLAAERVDYVVGLAEVSPGVTGVTTNEYVAEAYAETERVIKFASLNPFFEGDLYKEAHRLAALGFRGVKLYPTYQWFYVSDERLRPFYKACEELSWPVMAHTGSSIFPGAKMKFGDPLHFDEVAVDFPGVNFLIVHGGRGLWYERAEFLAKFHDNVYLEVSGLPPQKLLEYFPALERISEKVVFGSDWPANPGIAENMKRIAALGLSEEAVDNILGGNAARLLGLKEKI
ncbi:MAG: metal-dependent hydrolase [Deltaproteobacteria bacterium]|nr:MAG: metal-dependent hydrolase [Deltaproteobacteria bacterium]